jgi:hypothetical protein
VELRSSERGVHEHFVEVDDDQEWLEAGALGLARALSVLKCNCDARLLLSLRSLYGCRTLASLLRFPSKDAREAAIASEAANTTDSLDDTLEDPLEDVKLPSQATGHQSETNEPAQLDHSDCNHDDVHYDVVNDLVEGLLGLLVEPVDDISVELLLGLKAGGARIDGMLNARSRLQW